MKRTSVCLLEPMFFYKQLFTKAFFNSLKSTFSVIFLFLWSYNVRGQQKWLPEHPRLLFTGAETSEVRHLMETDPLAGELAFYLKEQADSIMSEPQLPYKMDKYGALLWTSRAYVYRLGTLALAYRIYGDRKYLDAANETLVWVCGFPDWHPAHYLDTAEMTAAVAIAYDWLFAELPHSTKQLVKASIYKNAIYRVLREYEKGGPGSWAKRETNWNVVCNTGMVLGALAVAEDYPEEAETILENAAKYMPNCLKLFAPDGVCYEGPAYWGYTNRYLSMYLKAVTDNGGDKGKIAELPGISRTAFYQIRTLTPSGHPFFFGNASIGHESFGGPAYFFYSKLFGQPEVAAWNRNEVAKALHGPRMFDQLFFLSLPWFDSASPKDASAVPAMEVYHNKINDIVVFNGNRSKKGSVYLVAKGGFPNHAHQHMDCGTFIIESDGVLWTEDLGADDYDLPGFWDGKPGGQRWKYFRNNNFSHNVINIDHSLQYAGGHAFVCEEHPEAKQPFAKLNLCEVYKEKAKSAYRKFTLLNDRTMEVEDRVELLNAQSKVSWVACTKAQVKVKGNKAHLMRDGKHFYMKIVAPANAAFKTYPAKNTHKGEKPIEGITMLEAECVFPNVNGTIVVRMSSKPL